MLELFRSRGDGARFRSFGVSRLFRVALAEMTDGWGAWRRVTLEKEE